VIRQLDLTQVRQATWRQGLGETDAYPPAGTPVFICPPISGWTLVVVGLNLDSDSAAFRTMLCALSKVFDDAQYFASYRVVDARVWQKARRGRMERAFSITDGAVTQNDGPTTREELALGFSDVSGLSPDALTNTNADNLQNRWLFGSEDDPLLVSGKWSVNPGEIGGSVTAPAFTGYLAQIRL
jgi:hypothetical protein